MEATLGLEFASYRRQNGVGQFDCSRAGTLAKDTNSNKGVQQNNLEAKIDYSRSQIFFAATRIYFERTLFSLSGTSQHLSIILDDTFALLRYNLQNRQLRAPRRIPPLSLFLIGMEARDECERRTVLDLITYSSEEEESRAKADAEASLTIGLRNTAMKHATRFLKRLWVKQDLHGATDIYRSYGSRLCQAFGPSSALPCFL